VRLFAAFRERAGTSEVLVDLPAGSTAAGVVAAVVRRVPALAAMAPAARAVVNQEFVGLDAPVHAGDDVALLPPVSGGAPDGPGPDGSSAARFYLTGEPLDARAVEALVADPGCGAFVTFVGTVRSTNEGRDVDYLEYEAYPGMAERKMAEIGDEIAQRWGLGRVAMAHRLGRCAVGEASIVICVASPHRKEAFEACHYAIDRVKEIVPIWKKEVWRDGSVWIGMHA
jgi:molybdopterin synthase catalytic subunit/molybdopterin converting factor small subunit